MRNFFNDNFEIPGQIFAELSRIWRIAKVVCKVFSVSGEEPGIKVNEKSLKFVLNL